jgi:hypothetical protein
MSERMIANPDTYHVPDTDTLANAMHATSLDAGLFYGGASTNPDMLHISHLG